MAAAILAAAGSACTCGDTFAIASGHLIVDPTAIAYGAVPIGTVQEVQVKVTNEGRGEVVVSSLTLSDGTQPLAIANIFTSDCAGAARTGDAIMTLEGNACATFLVRFEPNQQMPVVDSVLLKSNDPNNPTITIPITGSGVAGTIQVCLVDDMNNTVMSSCYPSTATPPPAMMTPPTVAFGSLAVGSTEVQKVRIFNIGSYNLAISSGTIVSSSPDFSLTGGLTFSPVIPPGMSYDVDITYTPSIAGMQGGNLVIPSNDPVYGGLPTGPIAVPLTANGEGPALCVTPAPPAPLAFGPVAVGASSTLPITITNCGSAPYNLTQVELVNGLAGSTVFVAPPTGATNGPPALPYAFAPGDTITVNTTYTPTTIGAADTGYWSINTDASVHALIQITGQATAPSCMSSGANLTPTASIEVEEGGAAVNPGNTTFPPLTTLTLNGGGSSAPAPNTISSYTWTLVSQPTGSVTSIHGSGATVTLFMEIVGTYQVTLEVNTADSCTAKATVNLNVVSGEGIHVQLTWPENFGDMDLHYVGPGGKLAQANPKSDLYYLYSQASACGSAAPMPKYPVHGFSCNQCTAGEICTTTSTGCTLDWGENDTCSPDHVNTDDATLDVDQLDGYGPENVTHTAPFDGVYTVIAVYYAPDSCGIGGGSGPVTAVIKIFVNGTLAWSGSMPNMAVCDNWTAATVTVANNGTTITVQPQNIALGHGVACENG